MGVLECVSEVRSGKKKKKEKASVSLEGVPKRHIKCSIWKELLQIRAPQRRNQPLHFGKIGKLSHHSAF